MNTSHTIKIWEQLKAEIIEASLEYWIAWNYEVAQGRKDAEEFESEDM